MKKQVSVIALLTMALTVGASTFNREVPVRQHGKEAGMLLDLGKISLGTLNDVEEKKQYLSTVQLEKQRIQNYTLRMVYENAYQFYKQGDYQRAQEMAQTILSIDPNFKQAQTLARQANHMGAYGTISEAEVLDAKFQEALALYDSGRLVEANDKLNEILTIQPGNARAQSWKRQIDQDIAKEYERRGNVAEKQEDYQAALNAWYNALLMRKNDPALVAKISETESRIRQQQLQDNMRQALALYNQGKCIEAYAVFERIKKIQPGDARVQKYMSQLKNEIAGGYYQAGHAAYSSYQFDQAVSQWNNAKKWGAEPAMMDGLIRQARTAKEQYLRDQQLRAQRQAQLAEQAARLAQQQAEQAQADAQAAQEQEDAQDIVETIVVNNQVPGIGSTVVPGGTPTSIATTTTTTPGEPVPGVIPSSGINSVSAEASAASRAKYIEGLDAYHQDDFERARQAWIVAKQLDPGNTDAELGLRSIEELMMSK